LEASLLLLLAAVVSGGEPPQPDAKAPPPAREEVVIAGEVFKLEIAADARSRARGLMERTEIDEHGGMLFIYRDVRRRSFWMKNCLVDIDLPRGHRPALPWQQGADCRVPQDEEGAAPA
jgi:hypothetical protein